MISNLNFTIIIKSLFIIFIFSNNIMASSKITNIPSSLFNFHGKTVLITGASQGLGRQFANIFNEVGARVILASRNIDKLNILNKSLKNSYIVQMDVSDQESVKRAFIKLEQSGEKIDICINNAAIGAHTPIFSENDNNDFELVIQTNLMGAWYVTKAAAIHMKKHNIHGSIINIGSVNGDALPHKEITAYSVSKAAVIHMTKSLVLELSKYNIRINTINPGPFRSDLLGSSNKHDQDFWKDKIPLKFIANPEDLDGIVLYLASNNASRYVTGSIFTIDGGISVGEIK